MTTESHSTKSLSWVGLVVGIIVFATLVYGWDFLMRKSATFNQGNVAVWVHTPHVAGGDTLTIEVGAGIFTCQ